jgi:hypothetical protein
LSATVEKKILEWFETSFDLQFCHFQIIQFFVLRSYNFLRKIVWLFSKIRMILIHQSNVLKSILINNICYFIKLKSLLPSQQRMKVVFCLKEYWYNSNKLPSY